MPKREKIKTVVVYSTMPVGKVVGEFQIKKILSYDPEMLWRKTKKYAGISKDYFDTYFSYKVLAHAFEIDKFELYKQPLHISEIIPAGFVPQSYCYIY